MLQQATVTFACAVIRKVVLEQPAYKGAAGSPTSLTVLYVLQLSLCLIKKPAKVIYAVKAHAVVVVTVMLGGVILLLYKVISGGDIVLQVSLSLTHAALCQSAMSQSYCAWWLQLGCICMRAALLL